MHTKTTFAGLFIRDDNRHTDGPRAQARHCWAVCDPRPGRAERAASRRQSRSVWRNSFGKPAHRAEETPAS